MLSEAFKKARKMYFS